MPSETEYLDREADDAREAASHTFEQMRDSLSDVADVKAWARTHPWTTMGAATAVGFFLTSLFFGRRRPAEPQRDPALLERILTDEQIEARLRELAAEDVAKPPQESALHNVAASLVRTFGPAVQSAIAAALAPQPSQTGDAAPTPESSADQPESSAGQAQASRNGVDDGSDD